MLFAPVGREPHTTNHGWWWTNRDVSLEPQMRSGILCLFRHSCPDYLPCVLCHYVQTHDVPIWPTDTSPTLPVVDAAPLLPSFLQFDISRQLRAYYVSTYNDKFFEQPAPTWFVVFITMEIFYHAPLSLWAIGALLRGTYHPSIQATND